MPEAPSPDELRQRLQRLRDLGEGMSPLEAEREMAGLLEPLFAAEGYTFTRTPIGADRGVDFVAERPQSDRSSRVRSAIQFNHRAGERPVGVREISSLFRSPIRAGFDRIVVVALPGFAQRAIDRSMHEAPVSLEFFDYPALSAWIDRIDSGADAVAGEIEWLVRAISHQFAVAVAKDARALMSLEWRDLERTVARIMEGLGFSVILTPASKDGGKDLILTFEATNGVVSYIVELKHWRAGNRVGADAVSSFLNVIVREKRAGGLFLSTSGYTDAAFEGLTEIQRSSLRFGATEKIVALAKMYTRAEAGLWTPPSSLREVLFESTL